MEAIRLSSVDEATQDLTDLDRRTNEAAEEGIRSISNEIDAAAPALSAVGRRIRRRNLQLERVKARATKMRADLSELDEQARTRQTEIYSLTTMQTRETREQDARIRKVEQLQGCLRERPEQELRGAATMLTGVGGQIEPGTLTYDVEEQTLRWTTTPIQVRDGFGGYLPRNYGRFRIKLGIANGQLSRGLDAVVEALDSERSYPHPHVSDSNPCLGNGQQVLLACLLERDYATAIATMTEFMEDYSDDNPYRPLIDFGDLNRWSIPTCDTGKHLVSDCTCDRCLTCCRMATTGRVPVIIQDCGSCSTCCTHTHQQDIHAPAGSGIPGSTCSLREE
jgi:hypothetical protein